MKKTATKKAAGSAAMAKVRAALVVRRQEILDQYENDMRVGQKVKDEGGTDIVDKANDAYNREIMFSLSNGERKQILEIEGAIDRIDVGKYGVCVHCKATIPEVRLQAVRWARYCIDCQEAVEDGIIDER